jgi:addiction module HigA family antidote
MATTRKRPRLPGAILRERYLAPREITITALAQACGVSLKHARAVVNGRASITAQTAARLATVLGTDAEYWLSLQNAVDLYDAQQRIAASGRRPRPMTEFEGGGRPMA